MKRFFLLTTVLWLTIFIAPLFTLTDAGGEIPELPLPTAMPSAQESSSADSAVTVTLNHDGENITLPLDSYLEGVVAAEMPALFPDEALRAQAIAARTYTMKKLTSTPPEEHKGSALCSNPAHCKAYEPISAFASNWGGSADEYTEKIKNAVSSTDGQILLYNNEPISAVFHSTSSGMTERAADVWGNDTPYLQSVKSPGETDSPRYEDTKSISPDDFKEKFTKKYNAAVFDANPENWFSDIRRSEAGGITSLRVAGISVKGSDIRSILGLNSTNFTITFRDGMLHFATRGYGHGVGMSQYGARAMALEGKSCEEILKTYYTGVTLGKISTKSSS